MTMTNELAGRICTPCRGGVSPMILHEAKQYLEQTPGWALHLRYFEKSLGRLSAAAAFS